MQIDLGGGWFPDERLQSNYKQIPLEMDQTNEIVLHFTIEIALRISSKIEIASNFTKIRLKILVGLKNYGGNTSVKRPVFMIGLVLGILSFVHTGSQLSIYPNYARPAASVRSK